MGRTTVRIRHVAADAFATAKKHQKSIDRIWGYLILAAVLSVSLWLWFHRYNPRIVSYASDLIPGVLAILIAFVPDLRKQHMAWRIAIIIVGIVWSVLLWNKEVLTDAAQREALRTTIQEANKQSDEHSDRQAERLREALAASGTQSDVQITAVNKNLAATTSTVIDAFSRTADQLNKRFEEVKPRPPEDAKVTVSFWPVNILTFPVLVKSLHPDLVSGTVDAEFTFRNTSKVTARNLEVWVKICDECSYAKEMAGFDKVSGSPEQDRHRSVGDVHPGVFFEKTAVTLAIKPVFTSIMIGFAYSCDNCGSVSVDGSMQLLTALIMR
jgi:hypothetical protein